MALPGVTTRISDYGLIRPSVGAMRQASSGVVIVGSGGASELPPVADPEETGMQVINEQSGTSYTLQVSDFGKLLRFTSNSQITLTVPDTIVVAAGQRSVVSVEQAGDGQVVVVGGGARTPTPSPGMSARSRAKGAEIFLALTGSTGLAVRGDTAF